MIRIIYDPINGHCVPDAKVEDYVAFVIATYNLHLTEPFKQHKPYVCKVGQGLIITYFRKALVEEEIDALEIEFEDKVYGVRPNGKLEGRWPAGLDDYFRKATVDILSKGRNKS